MQRRTFLQASAVSAGAVALAGGAGAAEGSESGREYFELRAYAVNTGKQPVMDDYLKLALIPALNRAGMKSVGVFHETSADSGLTVHVLTVYPTLADYAAIHQQVAADADYLKAAAHYLAMPATDPVYSRIESSLLHGIEGLPRLAAPGLTPRLFNLRIYESHNEAAGLKKIEMFNKGELAIFKRVGLTPVLFGQAVIGARLPNLTYLLVFDDDAARQAAWNTFREDAEWKKLKAIPEYEDKRIVSKITNKLLTPADYSQI